MNINIRDYYIHYYKSNIIDKANFYPSIMHEEESESLRKKIEVVCRQTDYSEEEAARHLSTFQGNIEKVINFYIDAPAPEDNSVMKKSAHQEIFKQIRTVMDDASKAYRESKGLEEMEQRRQMYKSQEEQMLTNDSTDEKRENENIE